MRGSWNHSDDADRSPSSSFDFDRQGEDRGASGRQPVAEGYGFPRVGIGAIANLVSPEIPGATGVNARRVDAHASNRSLGGQKLSGGSGKSRKTKPMRIVGRAPEIAHFIRPPLPPPCEHQHKRSVFDPTIP